MLGPLDLDLLGLIVTLNEVNLVVTATPNGGLLGDLFCALANAQLQLPVVSGVVSQNGAVPAR